MTKPGTDGTFPNFRGNTQTDGANTYTWDGESQMKTAAGVTYAYDGDGRRIAKVGSKLYWYGSGGEVLSETDAFGNTQNDYIFFGGKREAMVPASGSALFYAADMLGTSRVIVQSNGTLCYDGDFIPFGGERAYTNTCTQNYKFEGKERDTETGNDDFGARYYSWRVGRWLSSDWSSVPVPVPYANLTNPQTLNLYSMVADDPESFADLDGHVEWAPQLNFSGAQPINIGAATAEAVGGGGGMAGVLYSETMVTDATQQAQNQDKPQQGTQQPQQSNPQPQRSSVSVTTDRYSATSNGVSIKLTATVTGSNYANFNWVQTITTNTPLGQNPANTPYIDRDPGQRTSYYLNPSEQRAATAHGASTIFSDNPGRTFSGSTVSWHAHLSLVGIKSDGHYQVLKTFGYGFTINTTGVHIDPLRTPY